MQISYSFDSGIPGKHILILWSIHGDEVCGSIAIEQLRESIVQWKITLMSWKITCVPYANYQAYTEQKRQISHNLNRIFWQNITWGIYDTARYIESLILQSDFVLDLHSFSAWKEGFVFNDYNTPEVNKTVQSIPIKYVMTGWTDLYIWQQELDTVGFAKKNNISGITIECGQNKDPNSIEVAYSSILSVLESLHIRKKIENPVNIEQVWISVDIIIHKKDGYVFTKDWQNFDPIQKNETIGTHPITQESIRSSYDGIMIMPNASVENGWEWCYLWKIITNP